MEIEIEDLHIQMEDVVKNKLSVSHDECNVFFLLCEKKERMGKNVTLCPKLKPLSSMESSDFQMKRNTVCTLCTVFDDDNFPILTQRFHPELNCEPDNK